MLLSYRCIVTINVLWLFLTVPWIGLQCVIVIFLESYLLTFFLSLRHLRQPITKVLVRQRGCVGLSAPCIFACNKVSFICIKVLLNFIK